MGRSRFCLSIKEAQDFLSVSRSTLQRYIKKGIMTYGREYTKIGKYLFDPKELEKWLELRPHDRFQRKAGVRLRPTGCDRGKRKGDGV